MGGEPPAERQTAATDAASPQRSGPETILVAEDNEVFRHVLVLQLIERIDQMPRVNAYGHRASAELSDFVQELPQLLVGLLDLLHERRIDGDLRRRRVLCGRGSGKYG